MTSGHTSLLPIHVANVLTIDTVLTFTPLTPWSALPKYTDHGACTSQQMGGRA